MFGYVTPCEMELKLKDYEKFKAYYCGLCKSIKKNFGNLPRLTLNYDMTFLAILADAFNDEPSIFKKELCSRHPFKKRIILENNSSLDYAAFCNTSLAYYKLLDNIQDDHSLKSNIYAFFLKGYINKAPEELIEHLKYIEKKLTELYLLEKNAGKKSLDEISHPFAELTAYIVSTVNTDKKQDLYMLGYNLGKWIYIIDAFDDLEDDMKKGKFNAINSSFNKDNLGFDELSLNIKERIDFTLTNCGRQCLDSLYKLNLEKNKELLYNILQFGMLQKMDKIFNRK